MKPLLALAPLVLSSACMTSAPTLDSWNPGAAGPITDFVQRVTDPSSPDFVPAPERIAVFDNDGTLWAEQPAYFQLFFALDWMRAHADEHPEWRSDPAQRAALEGDMDALAATGKEGVLKVIMASHAGMSSEEFATATRTWLETARHPTSGRPYTEMIYAPMLELLEYLRAHDFKTFIVSGGGVAFMRVFSEEVYGIPPEQVVGSSIATTFENTADGPRILRLAEIEFIDDKEEKPVGIQRFIGRRPIAAFGNSDGDHQMLQWTAAGDGARLCALVHHTDGEREWSYDRDSHIGRLDAALQQARADDWWVIDMARDWAQVFAWQAESATDSPSE